MAGTIDDKVKRVIDPKALQSALLDKTKECSELNQKIKTLNLELQSWKEKYEKLEKETSKKIDKVEQTYRLNRLSEDTYKAVLRLKARNFSTYNICKECNENGYSITEEDVDYIVNKIPILQPSLELFFKEEKIAYAKAITLDTNIILQTQLDMCFDDINTLDDLIRKEKSKDEPDAQLVKNLINEKSNIKKVINGIVGNKVEDEKSVDDISTKREIVDNVMLNYTKKKSSSFRPQFIQKVN